MRFLASAAACLLLVGCGDDGREPSATAIAEVVVSDDGLALLVRIGGDGTGGAVSADESPDEVLLSGTSMDECPPNALCTGLVVPVYLDQPLGDRRLIDTATDAEIRDVVRCEESPGPVDVGTCEDLVDD